MFNFYDSKSSNRISAYSVYNPNLLVHEYDSESDYRPNMIIIRKNWANHFIRIISL